MIKKWLNKNKIAIMFILVLFLCLAIGWIVYTIYGYQLIKAVYESKSSLGWSMPTWENYLKKADKTMLSYTISFPFTIFFFSLLWKLYKYFLKRIEAGEAIGMKEDEKYIKYDILIAIVLYLICIILFFYPCLKSIKNSLK